MDVQPQQGLLEAEQQNNELLGVIPWVPQQYNILTQLLFAIFILLL